MGAAPGEFVCMKQLVNKYKAWQSRRELRSLLEWERTRAKGKARFVWRGAWAYCLIMIPAIAFGNYYLDATRQSWQSAAFWGEAIRYFVTGGFIAFAGWGGMEFKYNRARLGHKIYPADLASPPQDVHPLDGLA
jgi:hypothetical protein